MLDEGLPAFHPVGFVIDDDHTPFFFKYAVGNALNHHHFVSSPFGQRRIQLAGRKLDHKPHLPLQMGRPAHAPIERAFKKSLQPVGIHSPNLLGREESFPDQSFLLCFQIIRRAGIIGILHKLMQGGSPFGRAQPLSIKNTAAGQAGVFPSVPSCCFTSCDTLRFAARPLRAS